MNSIFTVCRDFVATIKGRWQNAMPRFFRNICWIGTLISGTAIAINTAITSGGGVAHEWWNEIYPYLLGVPAGAAFVAKFTQQYSGQPIDGSKQQEADGEVRTVLDRDIDTLDGKYEPQEIEPYDDHPNA